MERQTVTQIAHDVIAIGPESDDDSSTSIGKNPDWNRAFGGKGRGTPNEVNGAQRSDGV